MSEIKPLAGMERRTLRDVIPLKTPYALYIFPTNLCNFMCSYCGHSMGLARMREEYDICTENMPMEIFKAAIDQLGDFPDKLKVLNLTGQGEPLVNPLLPDMVDYAKRSGSIRRIETISNASLLTHELSDKLVEAGLDCIRISIQGMSTERYKSVCRRAIDFDNLVGEIRYLFEHKKQCEVFVKIMDISLDEGEDERFYKTFSDISDRMFIEQCRPVYSGVEMTKEMDCTNDRYGRKHDPRKVCPLCFYMLGIHPNGDIAPCETIYKPETLGNVMTDRLADVWNGEKNREFQLMQLRGERFNNAGCSRCCAPDDVAHPEDVLDGCESLLINKLQS